MNPAENYANLVNTSANRAQIEHDLPLKVTSAMSLLAAAMAEPIISSVFHSKTSYVSVAILAYCNAWEEMAEMVPGASPARWVRASKDIMEPLLIHFLSREIKGCDEEVREQVKRLLNIYEGKWK